MFFRRLPSRTHIDAWSSMCELVALGATAMPHRLRLALEILQLAVLNEQKFVESFQQPDPGDEDCTDFARLFMSSLKEVYEQADLRHPEIHVVELRSEFIRLLNEYKDLQPFFHINDLAEGLAMTTSAVLESLPSFELASHEAIQRMPSS